ncbi:hypothetical protein MSHI_06850 [Mycobacterium shinjukuense]|uniref:Uncharacterized protein n=1 Tax=Mycobacterium shinjukuense TaxID=398694 RepID=A0A7I7MN84_9MYCO|nr:hypothetical protein MSHI_06850 [Mycobacterium shinjukuense]
MISAPNSGGPAAAISRWVVFCVPSARPLQYGPAYSVIAVASKPLSRTASTEMVIISITSYLEPWLSTSASRNRASALAAAIMRTGRIRDPTWSDQRPTAIRPSAPSSCEMVTKTPASATDQPWWFISQTSMNVTVTVCGIISNAEAACIRHKTDDPRYGLASSASEAFRRDCRGGSATPRRLATAATVHAIAGNISPAWVPRSASSGITSAPEAIPNGCAVWRIPMARPRCCGGNQPDTSRPPALLQPPAAMPPRNKKTSTHSSECTDAAA